MSWLIICQSECNWSILVDGKILLTVTYTVKQKSGLRFSSIQYQWLNVVSFSLKIELYNIISILISFVTSSIRSSNPYNLCPPRIRGKSPDKDLANLAHTVAKCSKSSPSSFLILFNVLTIALHGPHQAEYASTTTRFFTCKRWHINT